MDRSAGRTASKGGRLGHEDWRSAERTRCHARGASRIALLATVVCAAFGAWTASASAVVVELGGGKRLSYQPLRGALTSPGALAPSSSLRASGHGELVYHGGPIMPSNTNYAFYWAPEGSPAYPAEYQSGVNQYLEDLAHDSGGVQNVDSVATQYSDFEGQFAEYDSHFGGQIVDTNPYPKNGCSEAKICLTDEQLQAELKKYVLEHGLPTGLTREYFILTPPGVEGCFEPGGVECSAGSKAPAYCAYHGFFHTEGQTKGPVIVYANDPFVTGNPGCDDGQHPTGKPSDAALEGGLSHEHNESITDPELDAWYAANGEENGDKCRTFVEATEYGPPLGKAPDGAPYNQLVNGHEYLYQQEWSNEGSVCKQRLAPSPPAVSKVSPKKGPAAGGTAVTITGSGFASATEVHFGAASAASFTINTSSSITALAPAGANGTVDVTVTSPSGTSATVSHDRFKYDKPTVSGVSPSSGSTAGGNQVTVTGSGFAPGSTTTFKFGKVLAAGASCSSTTTCTVTVPAAAKSGTVDVRATVVKKSKKNPPADRYTYL